MMIPGSVKGGIILLLSAVGCAGSLFVILVVALKRTLHTMHYFLLASLSLSDFLFHIFVIFVAVSQISEKWLFGTAWCEGNVYVLQCLAFTTILLLCALTWECHTALVTPYDFSGDITVKKLTVVVLLWIASFAFGATFFGWGKYVYSEKLYRCAQVFTRKSIGNTVSLIILFFIIPFGLITKQQYQIYRIAKRQKSLIAQQRQNINSSSQDGQQQKRLLKNIKASKDALIIVVAFLASYLPTLVLVVLRNRLPENEELYNASFYVFTLCQVGATCNPMIYGFRKRQFRQQILQLLCVNTERTVVQQLKS